LEQCKDLCDATSACLAFEIYYDHGKSGGKPGECTLNNKDEASSTSYCDSYGHNLDLYIKDPTDCVRDDVATKATCTASCGTVPAIVKTEADRGAPCSSYQCQPEDGQCPSLEASGYTRVSPGCIQGSNIETREGYSLEQCKDLCDATSECLAFEFYHDYGKSDGRKAGECTLNNKDEASSTSYCSSRNLDLYIKDPKWTTWKIEECHWLGVDLCSTGDHGGWDEVKVSRSSDKDTNQEIIAMAGCCVEGPPTEYSRPSKDFYAIIGTLSTFECNEATGLLPVSNAAECENVFNIMLDWDKTVRPVIGTNPRTLTWGGETQDASISKYGCSYVEEAEKDASGMNHFYTTMYWNSNPDAAFVADSTDSGRTHSDAGIICKTSPTDCVPDDVATKATCTASCGTVPAIAKTEANGGAPCSSYQCQPGDGQCPLFKGYDLKGKGICDSIGCSEAAHCPVNGYWKSGVTMEECNAQCEASFGCIGFSVSDDEASDPNKCLVHGNSDLEVPLGWTAQETDNYDISLAWSNTYSGWRCFKRDTTQTKMPTYKKMTFTMKISMDETAVNDNKDLLRTSVATIFGTTMSKVFITFKGAARRMLSTESSKLEVEISNVLPEDAQTHTDLMKKDTFEADLAAEIEKNTKIAVTISDVSNPVVADMTTPSTPDDYYTDDGSSGGGEEGGVIGGILGALCCCCCCAGAYYLMPSMPNLGIWDSMKANMETAVVEAAGKELYKLERKLDEQAAIDGKESGV